MFAPLICISLHFLATGLKGSEAPYRSGEEQNIEVEQSVPADEASPSQDNNPSLSEAADMTANTVPNGRTLIHRRYTAIRNQHFLVVLD